MKHQQHQHKSTWWVGSTEDHQIFWSPSGMPSQADPPIQSNPIPQEIQQEKVTQNPKT